jgi:hypothetical protein
MRRFQPGETIVRREIIHGVAWFAVPHICVSDEDDLLVTFLAPGTKWGFPPDGEPRHPYESDGKTEWIGHGMLCLHWPGIDHSVNVLWEGPQRRFAMWYFNLQDAPRRTGIGFDTLDHELDLLWAADAPTWEWKDEDKFAETGEFRYGDRVAEIRAEGARIGALLDAGHRWWDESWASWTPPSWFGVPVLPEGVFQEPLTSR